MATTLANISIKNNSSWNTYLDLIYPVGSIYISYTSTSPATRFGGTWSRIIGRFLYCTTNTTPAGSNTHTLTVDQIPSHNHILQRHNNSQNINVNLGWYYSNSSDGGLWTQLTERSGSGLMGTPVITNTGGASSQQYARIPRCLLLEENCLDLVEWVI